LESAAGSAVISPDDAAAAGAEQGRALAAARRTDRSCVRVLDAVLAELGFDPATVDDGAAATIVFTHCPFGDVAEAHPEVVCHLHRGLVEGFVEQLGGASVERFGTLADRDPCQVDLSVR
ncbi:MAG TPA: methanogen output domain 1-containing protein, partial [Acidimicrobiales bacterium]|nr:methanogen output domain 1-containing protein [Acidimicrobiales bacterium]